MAAPYVDPDEDPRLHPYSDATIRPGAFDPSVPPPASPVLPPPPQLPQVAPSAPAPVSEKPILDTKTTSQTTEKLSPEQQKDFAALDSIKADEQGAERRLTTDRVKDAAEEQKAADATAQAAAENQRARQEAIQQAQARRTEAEATYQQKLEAFNKQDFHSFFSSRPAAAEVLTDIGVALGAFGAAGRGPNEALQILNSRVEQDFNQQKARIEKARDSVLMAKTGVADADQARAIALEDLDIKKAAALDAIQARLKAGKAAQLGSTAAAQGDKDVAAIAQKTQELKEKTTAGMATRTTSTQNYINPAAVELKANAHKEAGQKEDRAQVFDKSGKYLGDVTSGKGGAQAFMTRDAQTTEAIEKAEALLKDVESGSSTNIIDTHRKGLISGAIGAAATTSTLGKTNEAQKLEAEMMGITHGPMGTSYINPDVLRSRIAQMKETQQNYRTQGLVQVKNGKLNETNTSVPKDIQGNDDGRPVADAAPPPPIDKETRGRLRAVLASKKESPERKAMAQAILDKADQ